MKVLNFILSKNIIIILGFLSTFMFYNPLGWSYWSWVIQGNMVKVSEIFTFELHTLPSWLWIFLGFIMLWSATWLFAKAWRALNDWHDKIFAIMWAVAVNIIVFILTKQHILEDWQNGLYLFFTGVLVIDIYTMLNKRAELGVYKVRSVGDVDSNGEEHSHN